MHEVHWKSIKFNHQLTQIKSIKLSQINPINQTDAEIFSENFSEPCVIFTFMPVEFLGQPGADRLGIEIEPFQLTICNSFN